MKEYPYLGIVALGLAAVITLSVWAHFYGPCSWFQYDRVHNIPARCIKELFSP